MKYLLNRVPTLLLAAIVGLIVASPAFGQATIVIENGDAAGVGFNDTTAVAPVGGNSGTTLGQQRLIAFQAAANIWGASISSAPTITIHANWAPRTCSANSGVLGSAGNAGNIYREFSGSVPGFWYGAALANALSGFDRNGTNPEITATFNINLGTPGCLETLHWYYGLDNNHGLTGVDLLTVLIHEFAHGLGFQTYTDSNTGAQAGIAPPGFPSIYDRFLFDNTAGKTWAQMATDAERHNSGINTNNLVWNGPQVTTDVPAVLSSAGTPRLRVNSPPGIARNYSIGTATFGPALTSGGVTANVAQASPADGCTAIGAAVSGKIALIDRGPTGSPCAFVVKAKNAQDAGAVGVIIADNVSSSSPPGMSGSDPTITIPTVSITLADGNAIKAQLGSGVNATLLLDASTFAGADQLGHALMFAPNPYAPGSSVSHWDNSEFPNQLMEPSINSDLTHSVTTPQDLTLSLLKDLGWPTGTPPPPPSPTPTPSPPPNDNFANAQVLTGCLGSVTGTNIAATKEAGEPNNPDSPTSIRSVWYRWQAPGTGSVTIDTLGSDFDTVLAVYTGSSVSGLTLVANNDDAVPNSVLTSSVTFSATQGTIYQITVNGFDNGGSLGDTGNIKLNWSQSNCVATVRLTATDFPIAENSAAGFVTVSVIREGDSTGAASVNFATSDTSSLNATCAQVTGKASERCDYATSVGTLSWAAGEAGTKTFNIPIINDAIVEGTETFNVTLSNPIGVSLGATSTATVTILDDDSNPPGPNPIDGVDFFITEQYIDFLGRMPDAGGFANWHNTLAPCPNGGFGENDNPTCDRIHVAAGFFQSQEFLDRGYWAFRFYMVSYNQRPTYAQFIPDMAQVGGSKSPAEEEAAKVAFANAFVLQSSFTTKYSGLSGQALADALLQTAGLPAGSYNAGAQTNGQILRGIAESQAALDKFLTEGTVSIQYFAFLRRDPDTIGYQNNVATLNANPSNLRHMIFIFIYSTEYRGRFGTP